jgi:large repetitive protein
VVTQPVLLQAAKGTATAYSEDRWRIGYGETGFETFTIDVPDALRGKVATLRFELSGGEVYIDNVFFKSQHLMLGNPTEGRIPNAGSSQVDGYKNNYLLEKSQFTVSYSEDSNIPNWSAWQLNKGWTGSVTRPGSFFGDPALAPLGWVQVSTSDYDAPRNRITPDNPTSLTPVPTQPNGDPYILERGHLTPVNHRRRDSKDAWATMLTTNIVPQHELNNDPLWKAVERFEEELVTRTTDQRELYVVAGSVGKKTNDGDKSAIIVPNGANPNYAIQVPAYLWQVITILDRPGLGISDITSSNTTAFAILTENVLTAQNPNSPPKYLRWNEGGVQIMTVAGLEAFLNADQQNKDRGVKYNFFSNLSQNLRTDLKNQPLPNPFPSGATPSSAFLLAESVSSSFDASVGHNSVGVDISLSPYSIQIDPRQISSSQVAIEHSGSTIEQGIYQPSIGQISSSQTGFSQVSFSQVSPTQVSPIQIGLGKSNIPQVSTAQIDLKHETFRQVLPTEIYPTQVQSFGFSESDNVWSKISNSAGIEAKNLFVSNDSSVVHRSLLQSVSNLQNTALSVWNGWLPESIQLVVEDLPTGQLAEANITRFDPTGRPTSGTLTLDTDANGLGWFIDSSPWDNAEFGTLNAETFFRATLGSEAYGHYDLLTTILHELGHLAGLISGNPTYDSRVQTINGTPTFLGNGYSTALTSDRSHLTDPTKLMGTYLAPGMRKLPSQLELQMLADLRNTPTNSSIRLANSISALQQATPMVGITNGPKT